ncbi:hypothetical protein HN011_005467, partial [Eciton burchellii]
TPRRKEPFPKGGQRDYREIRNKGKCFWESPRPNSTWHSISPTAAMNLLIQPNPEPRGATGGLRSIKHLASQEHAVARMRPWLVAP